MKTTYGKKRGRGRGERGIQMHGQLVRLLVCLLLFLAVFIGKEVWPAKIAKTGEQLLAVIHMNTDFRAAFAKLGRAMSQEDSVIGELGEFCVSVFASKPEGADVDAPNKESGPETAGGSTSELVQESQTAEGENPPTAGYEELQVGDVVEAAEQNDEHLPEGYSRQWLYLGNMDTATPVQGTVTSQFGYRDHPTIGRYAVHGGVDIAADRGTAVGAFAAGTVEAVGEDQDFGRWLRLIHSNGISSFYAHCSEVCVKEAEEVQAGQTVALVGSSGKSTGPHLHFEIMLNDVRLDPAYYIKPDGAG